MFFGEGPMVPQNTCLEVNGPLQKLNLKDRVCFFPDTTSRIIDYLGCVVNQCLFSVAGGHEALASCVKENAVECDPVSVVSPRYGSRDMWSRAAGQQGALCFGFFWVGRRGGGANLFIPKN